MIVAMKTFCCAVDIGRFRRRQCFNALYPYHRRVDAVSPKKRSMRPSFHNAARFQYQDVVGVHNRIQAVRNGDDRPAFHQPVRGLLQLCLRLRIEARRGLIEQKNGCILEKGACQRDALCLSAGHACSRLADHGLVRVGERLYETVQVCSSCGSRYLFICCIRPSKPDVGCDGVMEQMWVLRHPGDPRRAIGPRPSGSVTCR